VPHAITPVEQWDEAAALAPRGGRIAVADAGRFVLGERSGQAARAFDVRRIVKISDPA